MNIVTLRAAALGLSLAAVPAQAAIHSIAFTAEGTITETNWWCLDSLCFTDGMPAVGTPWTLSVEVSFAPAVPGTGDLTLGDNMGFDLVGSLRMPATGYWAFNLDVLRVVGVAALGNRLKELSIEEPEDQRGSIVDVKARAVHIFEWMDNPWDGHTPAGYYRGEGKLTAFYINGLLSPMISAPEPAAWAMMIAGFGMVGTAARRRRR